MFQENYLLLLYECTSMYIHSSTQVCVISLFIFIHKLPVRYTVYYNHHRHLIPQLLATPFVIPAQFLFRCTILVVFTCNFWTL